MNWDFLVKNAATGYDGNRLHPDIPAGSYGKIPALSYSILKQWIYLQHTPSEFGWWLEHRYDEPPGPSLIVGGIVDCLLVGPNVTSRYAIVPPNAPKRPNGRQIGAKKPSVETIDAINYWAEFDREARYRTVASQAQYEEAERIVDSLRTSPLNEGIFSRCHKAVATTVLFGEPFKAEFDLWCDQADHIMDIKTAQDVTPTGFGKAFINFGYNVQASLYLRIAEEIGRPKRAFSFLCAKNSAPYTTANYVFSPHDNPDHEAIYTQTLGELEAAVRTLGEGVANDFRPGNAWHTLEIPRWAISGARRLLTL